MLKKKANYQTVLLCLLCTFFWGAGYPIVKLSCAYFGIQTQDVPGKLLHAGCRFMLAGLLLLGFSWLRQKKPSFPNRRTLPYVLRLGLCQTVLQYGLLYIGLANTSGTKGAVLNQINVFLLVLLTPLFFKTEKLTRRKIVGCGIGFAGIIVMNLRGMRFCLEWGDLIVILSSCFAAVGYLLAKAMPAGSDPIQTTGWQQMFGGGVLLALGLLGGGRLKEWNLPGVATFLFLVVCAAAAYSLWFYLLQRNDVGRISVYKFLTPIFGVALSGLLLGESIFTIENIAALVLVCVGLIISNGAAGRESEPYAACEAKING